MTIARVARRTAVGGLAAVLISAAPPPVAQGVPGGPPSASRAAVDVPSPLTFRAALDLALSHNLELQAARLNRAVREAEVKTAGLRPNPAVSFEVSQDTPHRTLSLDVPLELGQRAHRLALAREQLTLADVDDRAAVLALRRRVRIAYYGLLAAEQAARLGRTALEVAGRVRDTAQARFEAGAAPQLEVMQAALGVARARADSDLAEAGRGAAQAELNAVFGRSPAAPLTLAGDLDDAPPLPTSEQAAAAAAASNAEVQAAEREVAIEKQRLGLLKAERLPTPVVSVGAMFDAPGEFEVGARAAVSLAVPLTSRNQGEIAASVARGSQAQLRRAALQREIEAKTFAVLSRAGAQRAQAEAYRGALVPTAEAIESLAEESYRLGRGSLLFVLEAQRSLRDVRSEALAAQLAHQSAIADLEDVLGGPIE